MNTYSGLPWQSTANPTTAATAAVAVAVAAGGRETSAQRNQTVRVPTRGTGQGVKEIEGGFATSSRLNDLRRAKSS